MYYTCISPCDMDYSDCSCARYFLLCVPFSSPDSEEGGYESNSNDEFNALYQAVEFYDALAESKKTESGRAYQKAVSNELVRYNF